MDQAHYPRPAPIEAYGNGGFRFAGMSHKGSLLCLPSGLYGWPPQGPSEVDGSALVQALGKEERISFVLFGMGRSVCAVSPALRSVLASAGIGLEPMDTGAACRTYNILLAEGRPVAAALIAVD